LNSMNFLYIKGMYISRWNWHGADKIKHWLFLLIINIREEDMFRHFLLNHRPNMQGHSGQRNEILIDSGTAVHW